MKNRFMLAVTALMTLTGGAFAQQSAEEFYANNTVTLLIGSGTGGGYDTVGRLVARHIGKHIPGNPNIIVQNVPGGGSLALANEMANITPRDGSAFAILNTGMPKTPLMTPGVVHYDPRDFHFVGSVSPETHVFIVRDDVPVYTPEDLYDTEVTVGTTAPGSAPWELSYVANAVLGMRFRIIQGYPSATDVIFAMENGEVDVNPAVGWVSAKTTYREQLANGSVRILGQFGMTRHPELEALGVPLFPLGDDEEDLKLFEVLLAGQRFGRHFMTPPDVPEDRLAALRAAFEATMEDPEFLADAESIHVEIEPISWQELTEVLESLYDTPEHIVERARALLEEGVQ